MPSDDNFGQTSRTISDRRLSNHSSASHSCPVVPLTRCDYSNCSNLNPRMDHLSEQTCAPNSIMSGIALIKRHFRTIFKYVAFGAFLGIVLLHLLNVRNDMDHIIEVNSNIQHGMKVISNDMSSTQTKLHKLEVLYREFKYDYDDFTVQIRELIEDINKLGSDKTGRTDFALESAGARIVKLTTGTENFSKSKSSYLGSWLCEGFNSAKTILQTNAALGECWAIKGSTGGAIIKLMGTVKIDAVSMEHVSPDIAPTGQISTAPKDFSVWGMNGPTEKAMHLGQFAYNLKGPLVQTFTTVPVESPFDYVEMKILSNQGNPEYTCVYRFRVHGTLVRPAWGK